MDRACLSGEGGVQIETTTTIIIECLCPSTKYSLGTQQSDMILEFKEAAMSYLWATRYTSAQTNCSLPWAKEYPCDST